MRNELLRIIVLQFIVVRLPPLSTPAAPAVPTPRRLLLAFPLLLRISLFPLCPVLVDLIQDFIRVLDLQEPLLGGRVIPLRLIHLGVCASCFRARGGG